MIYDLHDVADLIRERIASLREGNDACETWAEAEHASDPDECERFRAEIRQWEQALAVVRKADHNLNHD